MKRRLVAVAAALLATATAVHAAEDPLKFCLDENLPPLSMHQRGKPDSGFDVTLAQAVADRLAGRSRSNGSKASSTKARARPSKPMPCSPTAAARWSAATSSPSDSLVVPGVKTAKLPDFEGATRDDRRRRHPDRRAGAEPALYLRAADRRARREGARPQSLQRRRSGWAAHRDRKRHACRCDLDDFEKGRLIDSITHLVPGRDDLLGALNRGDFDATLLDLRRLDAYRAAYPDTKFAASGYYYPIGVNRGYVGLASDPALIGAVNRALSNLQAAGTIADLARAAGLTYLPPVEPAILGDELLKVLQQ